MTRQESFKRRVRERMSKTGERYAAARRVLVQRADQTWVSEPEMTDEAVRRATGMGWNEWRDLIDAWPGDTGDHAALVHFARQSADISGWWAQTVAVGYERIAGLRLKYQRPDGTFNATKSRTVTVPAGALREMLLDEDGRRHLFPGMETDLRSRPASRVVRLRIGPGTAQIAVDELPDGRARVSIAHEKLPAAAEVDVWKAYWSEWLDALDMP
ncbi:MAG: hypothetical protein ACLFWM_13390 [Actinomycetota bacterium]